MPTPSTRAELLDLLQKSGICSADTHARLSGLGDKLPDDPVKLAAQLVKQGVLTQFQAKLLLAGRHRGFKLGPYVIKDQLGQGGMGIVYLAEHGTLRRRVAIKVLTVAEGAQPVAVERFLREARAAAALDHPNIVKIYDVGQQGTVRYLVMEYVDGQTLDKVVAQAGPIACGRAVAYITQAAAGLQHAHEKGFVHRDIKPANLMLTKDGTIKILDMGLARSFEPADKLTEVLDQGAVVGTADFISPEQAMNSPDLDIRADIYSLGATFFTLVTGKPPFEGSTTQKLLQHQMKEPPSITAIDRTFPDGLAKVVATMLAKKPDDRFQTPAEVIEALAPWLPSTPQVVAAISRTNLAKSVHLRETLAEGAAGTRPLTATRQKPPERKAFPLALVLAGVGLVAAAGVVAGVIALAGSSSSHQPPTAGPVPGPQPAPTPEPNPEAPKAEPPTKTEDPKPAPPPTAPVHVPPQTGVVYTLDLTGRQPFAQKGVLIGDPAKPTGLKWMAQQTTGTGQFPPGWQPSSTAPNGAYDGSVSAVKGDLAIGVRSAGDGSGTLLTPELPFPSGKARLKVEYLTEGDGPVAVRLRPTQPKPAEGLQVGELPPTGGQWQAKELEFGLSGATAGRLEFVAGADPAAGVWVKGFTAIDPVPPAGKPLVRLNLSAQKPFVQRTVRFQEPGSSVPLKVVSETGAGKMPGGWYRWIEYPETVAEFFADGQPGAMALGVRAVDGPGGVQINAPEFVAPSGKVRVRVLYQTGLASPGFALKFRPTKPKGAIWDAATLPATGGSWRLAVLDLDLKGATGGLFEIYNGAAGADAAVRLREFTVLAE